MSGSFKFIHCADLHLGSRFYGISTEDEALGKKMRASTFKALDTIVAMAKKEKVDFAIFSGDIFDSKNETPLTRSAFIDALDKMKIPCFVSYGNHDYSRKWESSIPVPSNAFVFPEEATCIAFPDEKNAVAEIVGISHSVQHEDRDLTREIVGSDGIFSIGVVHCDLDSVSEGDRYAPCKMSSLQNKKIDYWALGHIHKREIVSDNPYVVYPGNTQGRNPKESGEKGAYIVTVTNNTVTEMTFFRTGSIVWSDVELDITGKDAIKDVISMLGDIERGSFIRVKMRGHGPLDTMVRTDPDGLTELIESRTGCRVSSLITETMPDIDLAARMDSDDFIAAVIGYGKKLETEDRDILIDMICSTTTSQTIRDRYEAMNDEELSSIARDAKLLVIEKIMEANVK